MILVLKCSQRYDKQNKIRHAFIFFYELILNYYIIFYITTHIFKLIFKTRSPNVTPGSKLDKLIQAKQSPKEKLSLPDS